jgi:hypothetical protein
MADKEWLTFPEAIAHIAARLNCGVGAAQAQVNAALASDEIRCSYTARAVATQERAAHAELVRSTEQSAAARGFKVSGSVLDVMRAR